MSIEVKFPTGVSRYYFGEGLAVLREAAGERQLFFLTDSNVYAAQRELFGEERCIVVPAGEAQKTVDAYEHVVSELLAMGADRQSVLVGVGGGVITDLAGLVGATYMRGIAVGFVPTSLLGMVDAAVGGKNGVNVGVYKNIIGTIRQPEFIVFEPEFLATLPEEEWRNGFAEVIKYGCIFDPMLFSKLSDGDVGYYREKPEALGEMIRRCVEWKNKTVQEDEQERGVRKLLNFGHTVGHAIENLYLLPHGVAVSVGMVVACRISERVAGFSGEVTRAVEGLLRQYGLPVMMDMEPRAVMEVMEKDKKRRGGKVDFIVLERIGVARVETVEMDMIYETLVAFEDASER